MLVIVGHGPSVGCVPDDFIDEQKVCRMRHAPKTVGSRVDIIISACGSHKYRKKKIRTSKEFWHMHDYRGLCVEALKPFNPKFSKPSTGLSAVIIARHKGYDEIGVIGFDYTLHPERLDDHRKWRHDLIAENKCLLSFGVIDLEKEFNE